MFFDLVSVRAAAFSFEHWLVIERTWKNLALNCFKVLIFVQAFLQFVFWNFLECSNDAKQLVHELISFFGST